MLPEPPRDLVDLPYAAHLRRHEGGGMAAEERYDTVHFDGLALDGPDAEADGAYFLECAVTETVITGGSLRHARFNDVWLGGDRLVGTSLADTDWLDVIADSCLLAGVEAFGSVMRRVVFRRCKFDSVNLSGATLREVLFEDCVLRDVDLSAAALTDTAFPGTSLERVRLGRAALDRADLRGATTLDLLDGYDSLRGAVINAHQLFELAAGFAHALGITVRDV
jgi:uncharacterized protein YjbI with pentapeptide repeats